ncbi:hypothetical protein PROFUN_00723 [Planoprotostelium fungivorum]|uniref:Ataxin-10 domain-containing protein n=1 Tax=Planoprotostelium fungivorum TaxID=1890364 RepID=A0A2P6NU70_9EUKA|nr:hypothetical protein PROFUN_00723 [Planoprotostelium fungivorum]
MSAELIAAISNVANTKELLAQSVESTKDPSTRENSIICGATITESQGTTESLRNKRRTHTSNEGMYLLRLLRNLAIEKAFQEKMRDYNLLKGALRIMEALNDRISDLRRDYEEEDRAMWWSQQATLTVRATAQYICNFVTGNFNNQELLWNTVVSEPLSTYLRCGIDRMTVGALCATVYNCIANSEERMTHLTREGHELLDVMLRTTAIDKRVATDEAFDWVYFCVNKILVTGNFVEAYKHLGDSDTTDSQVVLMKMVEAIVHKTKEDQTYPIDHPTCRFLVEKLNEISRKSLTESITKEEKGEDDSVDSVFNDEEFVSSNDLEMIFVLLQLFGTITVSNNDQTSPFSELLFDCGIVDTISDYKAEREHIAKGGKVSDSNRGGLSFGFKRDLVNILANLSFKNKKVQDRARELDLFPVLLASCRLDDKNPYIKEWSILSLRNLMEDNLQNQEAISQIKLQGPAPSAELDELGLKAEIENGKIKLTPVEM